MRAWVAAAVATPLLLALPPLVIAAVQDANSSCGGTAAISLSQGAPAGKFSAEQVAIARAAAQLADQRHLPARAKLVILSAGFQESGIRNLDYGDRDSVGWLQQRASWGSVAQRMDPVYAAGKFYDALVRVNGWETLPITVAAQRVQVSGFPDAYAKWEGSARSLLALLGDTSSTGGAGFVPVVELNPSGAGNWQSAVRDGQFWFVYQARDSRHEGVIHRLSDRGRELDKMTAEGADHAVSFVVTRGRVSVAFYGSVRTFTYKPHTTIARAHTRKTSWPHGEIAMDPGGQNVVIRNGNHYRAFDAASRKPVGVEVRTETGSRQGFGIEGTTLYVLTGPTNAAARVDSYDFTTGRSLGTVDVTRAGLEGVPGNREPEGMFGSQFGVKVYTGDRRRLRIYQLSAAGHCAPDAAAAGGGPVPAEFDHQGNPRTVEQAVAWMQRSMPNGAPGEPVLNACERYMNLAYGLGGGYPTAIAHWNAPGPKTAGMSVPPRGALVFWRSGNPAGHVALSLGNGQVISTDFDGTDYRAGRLSAGPITAIDRWGPRLGWRAPNFRAGTED